MKNIAAPAYSTPASGRFLSENELCAQFAQVRAQTAALTDTLSAEDCQIQSMPDVSPTKWHLAHSTWFFETFILEKFEPSFKPHDARYRVLFNSYYNGIGDKHPRHERGLISRPSLSEVKAYRVAVEERLLALLAQRSSTEIDNLLTLGLQHEQQHQELILTDIKHVLSRNPAQAAYAKRWPLALVQPQPLVWHSFSGGLCHSGHDAAQDGVFHFDNETPRHPVWLAPFELASRLVTYGEYIEFIEDGGYTRPELWLSMGWDWVQAGQRSLPLYWQRKDGCYSNFTLQGAVEIDPHTPVCHLSYFEADAYARWRGAHATDPRWQGARLPTEHEWEHAARCSDAASSMARGNFVESHAFHPLPQREAALGLSQLFGDVWEWTASNYNPYPRYRPWSGAVGEYNGKFMCNQFVLRGGSCATPRSHIRSSYRNFFPPDAQWQFSGLRLARDV
jgi:ergothioneine biosynthesis protein EgtB